jgi:hypothetical protein
MKPIKYFGCIIERCPRTGYYHSDLNGGTWDMFSTSGAIMADSLAGIKSIIKQHKKR